MKPLARGPDCIRLSARPPDTALTQDSKPQVSSSGSSALPAGVGPWTRGGASPAGPSAPPGTWPCSSCWGSCTGSRSTAPRLSPAPPCRGAYLQRWRQQAPSGEPAPTASGREETPQVGPQDARYSINSVKLRGQVCWAHFLLRACPPPPGDILDPALGVAYSGACQAGFLSAHPVASTSC